MKLKVLLWHAGCSWRDCYCLGSDGCWCGRLKGKAVGAAASRSKRRKTNSRKNPICLVRGKEDLPSVFKYELVYTHCDSFK